MVITNGFIYSLFVLGGTAIILVFFEMLLKEKNRSKLFAAVISIAGLALSMFFLIFSNSPGVLYGCLELDRYSLVLGLAVLGLIFIFVLPAFNYFDFCGCPYLFLGLILFSGLGILVILFSTNMITLYLAWELMSIPSYAVVSTNYRTKKGAEASLKYFVYGAISSALILYGISLIYGATNSIDFSAINVGLNNNPLRDVALFGEFFIIFGMGIKLGMIPIHMWIPDTYDGAPTLISGYLSAVSKVGAYVAFYKIIYVSMYSVSTTFVWLLLGFAAITMTLGNIFALEQKNIVRMLAYSSIAHSGYIMAVIATLSLLGTNILYFYLIVFAFADIGSFIAVWIYRDYQNVNMLDEYNGIYSASKVVAVILAINLLSLAGVPPLSGFAGKLLIFLGLINSGYLWLAILLAVNSALSLGYYGRLIKRMFLDEPLGEIKKLEKPVGLSILGLILALIPTILFGLDPDLLYLHLS